jgi:hypothetical protein
MRRSRWNRLAWPLFGLWVALMVTACVLQLAAGGLFDALFAPALGVLAFVGALLWVRRPGNPIGPLLLALAILVTVSIAMEGVYSGYDDDPYPPLAIRAVAALYDPLSEVWFVLVGIVLPLLFPTGRLPSSRWRPVLLTARGLVLFGVICSYLV